MSEPKQARRYYVAGRVQGVGYRFFAHGLAKRLRVGGYVRNLGDGRVEVYAIAADKQLDDFAAGLRRGPVHAMITNFVEAEAEFLPEFEASFAIEPEDNQ